MIIRSSDLHNFISYTGKKAALYWIGAQIHVIGEDEFNQIIEDYF